MSSVIPSIYKNQNLKLRAIFDDAPSAKKILCVALDYAKAKHVALICDGHGSILKKSFPVVNSTEGIEFLIEQINQTARRRKVQKKHIFLGGEDLPSYVENFAHALAERGFLVVRVNARQAKEQRENDLASTDDLDLLGIAKTMLSRRARVAFDPHAKPETVFGEIRDLSRARRSIVRNQTRVSNRIHTYVDRLFPGFLDSSRSGLTSLGNASISLMQDRFSSTEIARRKPAALSKTLRRNRTHHPEETAHKIIELARTAIAPNPNYVASQQSSLRAALELYQAYQKNAIQLKMEAAQLLASTPYAFLTTLPGISFVLSSGVAGELGEPRKLPRLDCLCGYSGVVPATYQTGGPDSPAITTKTKKRCNHILKDWVLQGSQKLTQYGPEEWRGRSARWTANGQHALFAGGRRWLRLIRTLTINQIAYQRPEARSASATKSQRAADAEATMAILIPKWRHLPDWQNVVFAEGRPLGFWRRLMIEMYDAHLPIPKE